MRDSSDSKANCPVKMVDFTASNWLRERVNTMEITKALTISTAQRVRAFSFRKSISSSNSMRNRTNPKNESIHRRNRPKYHRKVPMKSVLNLSWNGKRDQTKGINPKDGVLRNGPMTYYKMTALRLFRRRRRFAENRSISRICTIKLDICRLLRGKSSNRWAIPMRKLTV